MKAGGGSGIVEKNRNRRAIKKSRKKRHVKYSNVGYEVATTFIIIFGMCKRKSVQWEYAICANDNSWYI